MDTQRERHLEEYILTPRNMGEGAYRCCLDLITGKHISAVGLGALALRPLIGGPHFCALIPGFEEADTFLLPALRPSSSVLFELAYLEWAEWKHTEDGISRSSPRGAKTRRIALWSCLVRWRLAMTRSCLCDHRAGGQARKRRAEGKGAVGGRGGGLHAAPLVASQGSVHFYHLRPAANKGVTV